MNNKRSVQSTAHPACASSAHSLTVLLLCAHCLSVQNLIATATAANAFLLKNLPQLLELTSPANLVELVKGFDEMRAAACAQHPDACQICSAEIVAEEDRCCSCAGRTCRSCAGRTTSLQCPHCRSNAQLLPLVAADKIPITFSAMAGRLYSDFKPELRTLLAAAEEKQLSALIAEDDALAEEEQLRALAEEDDTPTAEATSGRRRRADAEEEGEEPPVQRQRIEQEQEEGDAERPARTNKEDKKDKEISTLLDFCAKHGDQRSFAELLADLDELRQWNHQRINIGTADSMDLNTLTEQWFLTANLAGISGEARFLFFLRQGEFFERLSNLCDAEGGLNHADEQGDAQHYSSALDYLRRALNYRKKDELQLRACHQFFEVWKEWHPIIAVAQSEFSWSWLKETLTKKKLLEAVRARKAIQALQQLPPAVPAPLLYNIPPRWREYPRRPDNVRAPIAPVPQPRLVGVEENPGPFPLEPAIAQQALSTMPPPDFIAEAQQALTSMSAAQQQEHFIRLAFTSNQLYREATALQQRAQQSAHTVPDPRYVDPNNAQQSAVITSETAAWSGKSPVVFLKHHTTVRQAVERQEQDFIIAAMRLSESAAKLHALNSMEAEEQRRLKAKLQAKALTAQAAQLTQQARALASPSFQLPASSSALVALR